MGSREILEPTDTAVRVTVESSQKLRDREQEALIGRRLREGFERDFDVSFQHLKVVDIAIKRERAQSKNLVWFEMEEPVYDPTSGAVQINIELHPDLIKRDELKLEEQTKTKEFPEGFEVGEEDFAELIGIYLREWLLRKEKQGVGKSVSEFEEDRGLTDELWHRVFDSYHVERLLGDRE